MHTLVRKSSAMALCWEGVGEASLRTKWRNFLLHNCDNDRWFQHFGWSTLALESELSLYVALTGNLSGLALKYTPQVTVNRVLSVGFSAQHHRVCKSAMNLEATPFNTLKFRRNVIKSVQNLTGRSALGRMFSAFTPGHSVENWRWNVCRLGVI